MKCFVKILFFPIIFLLSILTAFLRFVLGIGTMVLSLFEIIILLGAIEAFLTKDMSAFWLYLMVGFLLSPYGLPKLSEKLIGCIEVVIEAIKSM